MAKTAPAATEAKVKALSPWEAFPWLTRFAVVAIVVSAAQVAFDIRTYALTEYGYVIHEFDPWFNFRATQYLEANGVEKFFHWFDHRAWFPLGRPVGTTIYPGMQLTAVGIYRTMQEYGDAIPPVGFLKDLSGYTLNDVCCLMPCWFGVIASLATGLLAQESTGSSVTGALACFIMAIIPAHIMRSVGGGFDNESVAVSAMVMTFYLWVRSLRPNTSLAHTVFFGILCGLSYVYMVAAWGGFIFVLNIVSFHAFMLCFITKEFGILADSKDFSYRLVIAFSLFYVIGTAGAVQIPVVGWAPLKSLEQLFGLVSFGCCAAIAFCQFAKQHYIVPKVMKRENASEKKKKKSQQLIEDEIEEEYKKFLFLFASALGAAGVVIIGLLYPTGYFGPLSSRIRGLFVPHTRTGNPLVDSVAEHRAASPSAYIRYLHVCLLLSPIGFGVISNSRNGKERRVQNSFLLFYTLWSYYFSSKMVRLIILLGPCASCLSGIALEALFTWAYRQLAGSKDEKNKENTENPAKESSAKKGSSKKKKQKQEKGDMEELVSDISKIYDENSFARKLMALTFLAGFLVVGTNFFYFCHDMARRSSHPSIMFKARDRLGKEFIVDDYREAYFWLRDTTPEDSRVMAWWDYGYQISGIGERITIADGNTWNHEHIATLGKCLVSEEHVGHDMIKHLADYVLVWTGGGGDDLAKSPHIARIANSVYSEICGLDDPLCRKFGFQDRSRNNPLPMMRDSVIYKLHSGEADENLWQLVYTSKHKKVKIYKVKQIDQQSRDWSFDEKNYECDESGWLCRGNYPPKFRQFMHGKKDFAQLEDFNVKREDSAEYQKKYHEAFSKGN